jgi:predicted kinase
MLAGEILVGSLRRERAVMSATVHLLCGKTGSGKTMFARRLEQERRAVALSVDPWMIRLFGQHMRDPAAPDEEE